jgi:predicted nuclease with TOPRIM domain
MNSTLETLLNSLPEETRDELESAIALEVAERTPEVGRMKRELAEATRLQSQENDRAQAAFDALSLDLQAKEAELITAEETISALRDEIADLLARTPAVPAIIDQLKARYAELLDEYEVDEAGRALLAPLFVTVLTLMIQGDHLGAANVIRNHPLPSPDLDPARLPLLEMIEALAA